MRPILCLAFGLALFLPRALHAEPFRVERAPDGQVRVLARVLEGTPAHARAGTAAHPAGASAAVERARVFLQERSAALGLAGVSLAGTSALESPGGLHVVFPTVVDDPSSPAHGLPVLRGEVAAHQDRFGEVLLVSSNPRGDLIEPEASGFGPILSEADAVQRAVSAAGVGGPLREEARVTRVAVRTRTGFKPAWQVEFVPERPGQDWFVVLGEADGSLFQLTNRILNAQAQPDFDGTAFVFDPNPITATGDSLLEDWSDVDPYRVQRGLPGLDGSGYVRGPYVDTQPMRQGAGRANEPSLRFDYSRNDPFFEEANVYYHIDRFQRRLQNLGFTNANNRQIRADVHYMQDDNSWYEFFSRSLQFGDGGVDDAEDEEIIIHEYGHAMHHNIVPSLASSDSDAPVRALSEGWSDYLAASYGGNALVGEWDASSYSPDLPPFLRRTDNFLIYPDNLVGRIHDDGEIWSGALWALREALGPEVADRLAIESYYFTSGDTDFRDAGWALVLADWTLYGGEHRSDVESVLAERGLLPPAQDVFLTDDAAVKTGIGFPFTFFGVEYDSVFVGSNGNLTFGAASVAPAADVDSLAVGPPRIALFWSDLDPTAGTVEIERAAGSFTVRYAGVPAAGQAAGLTASVSFLAGTNDIQMTFEEAPGASALVGVAKGGGALPFAGDLTTLPVTGTAGGVYESFVEQAGAFALAGRSLRFVPVVDGTYEVRDPNIQSAVQVTHFEAVAERGAVRLRWGLPPAAAVVGFRVERASGGAAGAFLGAVQDPRPGENEFLDTDVRPGTRYGYWVHLIERNGETTIAGPVFATVGPLPPAFLAPNPFRPGSAFRVEGAGPGEVSIAIFDVRGRRVRELRETQGSGTVREIVWHGEDERGRALAAGIYFVRLRGDGGLLTRRILLMR